MTTSIFGRSSVFGTDIFGGSSNIHFWNVHLWKTAARYIWYTNNMAAKSVVLFVVLVSMPPVSCWNPPVGYVPGSPKLNARPVWPSAKRCDSGYGTWLEQPKGVQSKLLEQLRRENKQLLEKVDELSGLLYAAELHSELLYGVQHCKTGGGNKIKSRKEVQNARWLKDDTFIVLYKLVWD